MGRQLDRRSWGFRGKDLEHKTGPADYRAGGRDAQTLRAQSGASALALIAAQSTVKPVVVPEGRRTLSEKQMFLAISAPDSYQYDMRHFVGELQERVGLRNPIPVEPKPKVELDDEERAAERQVWARRDWGRYWARKRRQDTP